MIAYIFDNEFDRDTPFATPQPFDALYGAETPILHKLEVPLNAPDKMGRIPAHNHVILDIANAEELLQSYSDWCLDRINEHPGFFDPHPESARFEKWFSWIGEPTCKSARTGALLSAFARAWAIAVKYEWEDPHWWGTFLVNGWPHSLFNREFIEPEVTKFSNMVSNVF